MARWIDRLTRCPNLFITARTVEGHLTHAYEKLAITSREQLPAALAPPSGAATAPPQQPR